MSLYVSVTTSPCHCMSVSPNGLCHHTMQATHGITFVRLKCALSLHNVERDLTLMVLIHLVSQVEEGKLEKVPPFQLVSATHSEALLVTMDTGVLYQWSSDCDNARPYPLTDQLKLVHGGIRLLKSSDIRTTLVLDTGEIATFYDPLLQGWPMLPECVPCALVAAGMLCITCNIYKWLYAYIALSDLCSHQVVHVFSE